MQDTDEAAVAVAVDVGGPARSPLLRVVEGALGWPVVAADDRVLPPRCVLADPAAASAHVGGAVPVVLVVDESVAPAVAARAGAHVAAVLDGVPDAAALRRVVADLRREEPGGRRPWCTVTGSGGGVGATTVATALAGLRAWRHGATLLATTGRSHQPDAPTITAGDLASPAVWAAAAPVRGVRDLRVVALRDRVPPPDAGPVPLVVDLGGSAMAASASADVVVVRPDAAGLAAAERALGVVVVNGRGALDLARVRAAADGRPVLATPWSARVAAAALAGRMPADLPGTWLRPLAQVVDQLVAAEVAP